MKLARLALGLAFALMLAAPAWAADLGGNCCADLEERISELEATTARKGNRKMSVVIYGQVDKALMWNNIGKSNGRGVIDNGNSPTTLGVKGEAKISPSWSAGFLVELGVDNFGPSLGNAGFAGTPDTYTRQANVWIESAAVGRLTMGKGLMATDGAGQVTVANTQVAARMLSLEPLSSALCPIAGCDLPYDGGRRNIVRYDSPTMSGFILSASWTNGGALVGGAAQPSDAWDVSIRYAGEFAGIRVAAAAGYRDEQYVAGVTDSLIRHDHGFVGSASVMHMTSGLFLQGAYGKSFDPGISPTSHSTGVDDYAWHAQGGIEKNLTGAGALTFYGEYAKLTLEGTGVPSTVPSPHLYGVGVVQRIDAAATDVYASYRRYELDGIGLPNGRDNADVFMTGVRVKF
jgi:predicted porin